MPTTENDESLAVPHDPFRASLRASQARRDAAFRARRWRLRGRAGAAVLFASLTVLVGGATAAPAGPADPSQQASTLTTTRAVQQALGVPADGVYGPQTRAAVKRFQLANGLVVDGIAGPQTLAALGVAGGQSESQALAARTTTTTTSTSDGDSALLERIAECESGGELTAISKSGTYRGKYQFSRESWRAVGGTGDPAAASEAEQDKRAAMLLDVQGPAAWPVCSNA